MAHILIADDDAHLVELMATILAEDGHSISTSVSGAETLMKLGIKPEDAGVELPDLILLDIIMPQLDGYTLGTVIRNNPRTRVVPILVVSALQEMMRLFTATVQVDGFLAKPFTPEGLVGKVAEILEKHRAPVQA